MAQLGMALVGCGFMGRRHLLGYEALHHAGLRQGQVVAVLDLDPAAAMAAADDAEKRLGRRPAVYTTLADLLADGDVEAVDVVTEPRTHADIALAAMESGRHVLCEKPLALTIAAARRMVDAAERTERTLATGENYRRGGANRVARAVIESGLLGRIHLMREFRVGGDDKVIISKWRHQKASGSIGLDMAIHYADIVEYYVGPVERVWGRGTIAEPLRYPADGGDPIRPDGEDSVFAGMLTRDGVDVQLAYLPSGRGKHYGERTVHGSRGSMEVPPDRTDGEVIVHLADRDVSGPALVDELGDQLRLSPATTAVLGPDGTGGKGASWARVDAGYLAVEIDDFVDAVLSGRPPEVDGMGGLRALAVVHAVFEAGLTHREISVQDVVDGLVHSYQDGMDEAWRARTA